MSGRKMAEGSFFDLVGSKASEQKTGELWEKGFKVPERKEPDSFLRTGSKKGGKGLERNPDSSPFLIGVQNWPKAFSGPFGRNLSAENSIH
jgi:hypothetical protein